MPQTTLVGMLQLLQDRHKSQFRRLSDGFHDFECFNSQLQELTASFESMPRLVSFTGLHSAAITSQQTLLNNQAIDVAIRTAETTVKNQFTNQFGLQALPVAPRSVPCVPLHYLTCT